MARARFLRVLLTGLALVFVLALLFKSSITAAVKAIPDMASESQSSATLVSGPETPRMSDAFVDAIGVNIHLNYTGTNYNDRYAQFRSLLVASGIRHVRDGLVDTTWDGYYRRLDELARSGIHATLITSLAQSTPLLQTYPSRFRERTIDAIEGPNEFDAGGDPDWAPKLAGFQQRLYRTVRGAAAYTGVTVVGPSLTRPGSYGEVGDLADSLDAGNLHPYPAGHEPGTPGWGFFGGFTKRGSLAGSLDNARRASGTKPLYITETGYGDAPTAPEGVPPAVKARYTVRELLEAWNAGVTRTYVYQFLDAGIDGFQTYGLITYAMTPKPAYTALKNVISHLADPGPAFGVAPLNYTLAGPSRLHHTLLERRDGSYALALWLALPSWNTGSHEIVEQAPQAVTLSFGSQARRLSVTALQDSGEAPTRTLGDQRTVTLPVSGNVTIVDIR